MTIAVLKETALGETRVALVPEVVAKLVKEKVTVTVESGAGLASSLSDDLYAKAGAEVRSDRNEIVRNAAIITTIHPLADEAIAALSPGACCIGLLDPHTRGALLTAIASRKASAIALELIPRISRAQTMDILSSQATVAGYKAVLLAAERLPKFFPMLTTAAGTITAAKVLVIGAGVAGLQAIATARRLGAIVTGFDIRPEAKDQILSLGAKSVEIPIAEETRGSGGYAKEVSEATKRLIHETLTKHIAQADVVITTAQVPGKRAPLIVTDAMIAGMRAGSVIVDLAAPQGGNCEGTEAGKDVLRHGVLIMGPANLPATMPLHASFMVARNIAALLKLILKDGELSLDLDDEIVKESLVVYNGEVRWPRT